MGGRKRRGGRRGKNTSFISNQANTTIIIDGGCGHLLGGANVHYNYCTMYTIVRSRHSPACPARPSPCPLCCTFVGRQIHTGLQHGIIWPSQANGLPLSVPTVADKLREAGYATHAVGKWHLGFYKADYTPLRRGFDSHYGTRNATRLLWRHT